MTTTEPTIYDPPSGLGPDLYASTLADQTLHALVVHRMLASDQLHRMMSPGSTIDATYYRLGQLRRAGLADGFPVRSGQRAQHKVWHATAAGVERALSDPDLTRRYVVTRPKTSRNLVAHTLAVNEAGLAFISHARRNPGHECDYLSWEHEVAHSLGAERRGNPNLITDAVLSYTVADPAGRAATLARRFVELDRGTEPPHVLFEKLRRYALYHDHRPTGSDREPWWKQRYPTFPALCLIIGANPAKTSAQLTRRLHTMCALAAADPLITTQRITVMACRFEDLTTRGPGAAIWWMPGRSDPVTWTGHTS